MVRIRVSYHIFKFLVTSSSPTHKLIWYSCIMHSVKLSKQFAPASLALYLISVILSYYVWQLSYCRLVLKYEVIIHFLFFNFLVLFLNLYYSAIDHLHIPKKKEKKTFLEISVLSPAARTFTHCELWNHKEILSFPR